MIIPLIKRHVSLISLTFALALVVCSSSGAQCPPFRIFNGETIADEFGKSVASAGDVNLDDYDDIIIGAPYNDEAGSDAGKAYVFSGKNGDTLYTLTGEAAGDFFGKSVASAGDIDLDGFDDLFVGAPRNDAGGSNAGRAYVFSGKTGALIYMFTGEVAGDLFGTSISIAKVNHDNYYDLIVGAPRNDASGVDAGRVYVFSGKTGLLLYTLDGETTGDLFGSSVSGAGDIGQGHGHPILIGAPGNSAGGADAGRAYLYAAGTTSPALTFTGPSAGVRFGISVSGGGAINSELRFRVIIGASGPPSIGPYSGRAYVYDKVTAALIYTFTGDAGGDNFGVSVSGIGDVNADGVDDMVVGASGNDAGGTNAGKAYVYSGLTGTRLNIITGESPGDFLGASVSGAGNTNKDDLAEAIIGAPGRAAGATTSGRAYLSFGKKCGEVIRVPQDRATIQAGLDIAVTNDTVLVDDGTYSGVGNRVLDFRGKNIILKSRNGPEVTVIDCNKFGRGLYFHSGEDTTALVEGFTIRNGYVKQLCTFIECFPSKGGGIYCVNSSPTISNNVITLCEADYGAGIACSTASPVIVSNTIINNTSTGPDDSAGGPGGGIYLFEASPRLVSNIIAFNNGGEAVNCSDTNSYPALICCDLYANEGGDWVGCIADQANINDNFSIDPLFCDTAIEDFHLSWGSTCLSQYSPCGGLAGVFGQNCEGPFPCADANGDSLVTQDDIAFLRNYYSQCDKPPFPLLASDVNCDGIVDIQDIIYLAAFLNANGPAPCCQ